MSEKRFYNGDEIEENDEQERSEFQNEQTEQIIESGAVTTKGRHTIHCLTIIGQVEGHYILPPQNKSTKYEHVIPQLVAIQEDPAIEGLIIILNTVGGDVEAGLAIAELVSGLNRPTVSLVLGGGHSIGVPLAVSARQSFIVPSATMTIHPVRMNGVVLGVPQTLSYFDKMQERIVNFVEDNSNIDAKEFRKLMMNMGELVMDVGTVLDGEAAVKCGLIDHIGGLSDAMECLYQMIDEEKEQKRLEAEQHECRRNSRNQEYRMPRSARRHRRYPAVRPVSHRTQRTVYPLYAGMQPGSMPPDYAYGGADREERRMPPEPTAGSATGRERQNTPPHYKNNITDRMHKDRTDRAGRDSGRSW